MTVDFITASPPHGGSLRKSVFLLAQLAAKAAGAEGYSVVSRYSDESDTARALSCVSYPIHLDASHVATLAFTFSEVPIPEEKLSLLNQMAAVIQAVQWSPLATARVAARIASLDAELADIKIGERTQGLLASGAPAGEAVETIVRHVEHVLERRQIGAVFDQLLPDLEERVEERKLLMKAKALLQDECGMSEEQAYLHLRIRSRSSRKRLREVARELISRGVR
jgi:hypothetical protein